MDTQVDTRRLIQFQFLQVTYSHRHLCKTNPHMVFTITYHYVVREVKIMLPIKVIWLSFAHHWVSIYISSYICFECHWALPRNSTLKPIGNVHDSFLLPAWLYVTLQSFHLIFAKCRFWNSFVSKIFWWILSSPPLFFFLYCFLSSMQWVRGLPPAQGNVFRMLHIYNNIQRSTPAFPLTLAAPSSSVFCVKLHLAVIFRLWPWFPLRTKHTSSCWQWEDKKVERNPRRINQSIVLALKGTIMLQKKMTTVNQYISQVINTLR